MLLHLLVVRGRRATRLEAFLQPGALLGIGDVHVLETDLAAIGLAHPGDDLAQRGILRAGRRAGLEHRIHVRVGEAVGGRVERRDVRFFRPLQGIEIGLPHAHDTIAQHHDRDIDLLLRHRAVDDRRHGRTAFARHPHERLDDRRMGDVLPAIAERVEIGAPVRAHRVRIGEIRFVLRFDERRVATVEGGRATEFFHHLSNLVQSTE